MYEIENCKAKFTAGQAAEVAGVEYHHVNHWAKTGLIRPSVQEADGSDSLRVYSFADVVAMRVIGELRSVGFSCGSLKSVAEHIQSRRYKSIGDMVLLGSIDEDMREVGLDGFQSSLRSKAKTFAWALNLRTIVEEVDEAALKRVKATRGRASAVV